MLSSRCYLRKDIQNCMCLIKIVARMLKEEYNCNISIQKTLYARMEKVFTFNFESFDIPNFFIGSGKNKLLFKNKFYFDSTVFKYDIFSEI